MVEELDTDCLTFQIMAVQRKAAYTTEEAP